jgi:hypothetical protein
MDRHARRTPHLRPDWSKRFGQWAHQERSQKLDCGFEGQVS